MNFLVITLSFLIIVTKLWDCLTTERGIRKLGINGEQNLLIRKMMLRYGHRKIIWGVFLLTIIITVISAFYAFLLGIVGKILCVLLAFIVSISQFAVALQNYQGRPNALSRILAKWIWFTNEKIGKFLR